MRARDVGKGALVLIVVVALIVGATFGHLYLLRPYLNMRRQAIQHSQQYIEAKQSLLLQLLSEYERTTDAGQKSLLFNRMRLEAERIPADTVPRAVSELLRRGR